MTIKESDLIKDLSVDQLKKRDALASSKSEGQKEEQLGIDFKDFIAIFIASLQTIFLPVILMIIILLIFGIILGLIL